MYSNNSIRKLYLPDYDNDRVKREVENINKKAKEEVIFLGIAYYYYPLH